MYVKKMVADKWRGTRNFEEVLLDPTVADVERAVDRLDAQTFTLVLLQGPGEAQMGIGGGEGRYVVYATFNNETFWNLVHPESIEGKCILNVGGQEGEFHQSQIVTKREALSAGRTFAATGELESTLDWHVDA